MKVIDLIKKEIPTLNNNQLSAIQSIDGPVLIIAGPGTGKTQTLILRALYILLTEKAKPEEIVLTTFTEKAAFELRDRISQLAKKMHYSGQLHKMKIGTIHGICNDYIGRYLSADIAEISKGYSILEGLSQQFFIYENLDDIAPSESDLYLNKWKSKWSAISNLCSYFNKMTEELVDPEKMLKSREEFHVMLGNAYNAYSRILMEQNKLDFSNIQKVFWNLLKNKKIYDRIRENTKFIMVDEYQDTNYIQEQIIYKLASPDNNLCVVGDEDQSLYRFRGATVRNILEFSSNFPKCTKINLSINYRSHENIIERNNKFMESIEWGKNRYEKRIEPIPKMKFPSYPSVFCIWGKNEKDEANKVVDLINYLKDNKVIDDYSDIALLLRSVQNHSSHYIDAFNKKGIKFFCPRAKKYFDNDEVKQIIACYVLLFLTDDEREEFDNEEEYLLNSLKLLNKSIERDLKNYIQNRRKQIEQLQSRGSKDNYALDLTLLDFFYIFLAFKPFSEHLNDKNRIHNLAGFSALLTIFQEYYKISVVTGSNKRAIKYRFFASFLRMLLIQGISEYEDPDEPLPKGYVQIMTIHQAKGLEFPVVITGSLNKRFSVNKMIDRDIGQYYRRKEFEDESLITEYDRMRHFYVAFTRAQKLLVLTTHDKPQKHFSPIWDGLEQYPHIKKETLKAQKFQSRPQFIPKKSFSLSGVNAYEICPRQYQYYVEYSFSPSKTSHFLFGNLVHYTIEDIHNYVLAEKRNPDESQINAWFGRNYGNLVMKGFRQLFQEQKARAFKQVMDYFNQNKDLMHRIKETEVEVSYEKEDYIVSGRIDLLISERDTFDILDFKTQPKSSVSKEYLDKCFNQLCLYSSILHKRDRININRMFIYWTSEELRQNALMEFKYNEKHLKEMDDYFDSVVQKIKKKDFCIREKPDPTRVCKQCDLRFNCAKSRLIKFKPEELEEI